MCRSSTKYFQSGNFINPTLFWKYKKRGIFRHIFRAATETLKGDKFFLTPRCQIYTWRAPGDDVSLTTKVKLTTVAEGYIQDTVSKKLDITKKIHGRLEQIKNYSSPSTSAHNSSNIQDEQIEQSITVQDDSNMKTIAFKFNINVNLHLKN